MRNNDTQPLSLLAVFPRELAKVVLRDDCITDTTNLGRQGATQGVFSLSLVSPLCQRLPIASRLPLGAASVHQETLPSPSVAGGRVAVLSQHHLHASHSVRDDDRQHAGRDGPGRPRDPAAGDAADGCAVLVVMQASSKQSLLPFTESSSDAEALACGKRSLTCFASWGHRSGSSRSR